MVEPDQLQALHTALKLKNCELLQENDCLLEQTLEIQATNQSMTKKLLVLKEHYEVALNNMTISLEEKNLDGFKENFYKLVDMEDVFNTIDVERQNTEKELRELEECISKMEVNTANFTLESNLQMEQQMNAKQKAQQLQQKTFHSHYDQDEKTEILSNGEVKISEVEKEESLEIDRGNHQQVFTMEEEGKILVEQEVLLDVKETNRDLDQRKIDCETND